MKKGLTIAYLKADSYNEYDSLIIAGLRESLAKTNSQLLVFSGRTLFRSMKEDPGIHALSGFIQATKPDGIIATAWLTGIRPPHTQEFLAAVGSIPLVFMGEGWEGRHYTHLCGGDYMTLLLEHLYHEHGRRRIAFIAPIFHDDREDAWLAFTKKYNCYDPRLFVSQEMLVSATFVERAELACQYLFDHADSPRPDAIVSLFSEEGLNLLSNLKKRGIEVPRQVSLTTWEDGNSGRFADPPLTSVEYPYYEIGKSSAEVLIDIIQGKDVPIETKVPTRIFYRASCGCTVAHQLYYDIYQGEPNGLENYFLDKENDIFERLKKVTHEKTEDFFKYVINLIGTNSNENHLGDLQKSLNSLNRRLYLTKGPRNEAAFLALQGLRNMLDELVQHRLLTNSAKITSSQQRLNLVSMSLVTASDSLAVLGALEYIVKELGLSGCWVFSFKGLAVNIEPTTSLEIYFWSEKGRRKTEKEGVQDLASNFFAQILKPIKPNASYLGQILNFSESEEAFLLISLDNYDTRILEGLARILSSSLSSAMNTESLLLARNELRILAEQDALTGLNNRYTFNRDIQTICNESPPIKGMQKALLFLDLDGFKPINDSYGHDAGDDLLRIIALRLGEMCLNRSANIYRVGGDEFVVLLDSSGPQDTVAFAKKIINKVKEPHHYKNVSFFVGVSIGCAHFPRDARDSATLIKYADISLYRAKEKKGSIVVFDKVKDAPYLRRIAMRVDIKSSLINDEIEVAWQGIFENTGGLAGIEALVRWRHPEFGILLPDDFLDIASATNMIVPIEKYVLNRALEHVSLIRKADPTSKPFVLVNCSQAFFFNQDFLSIVQEAIETHNIEPGSLRFGVTETIVFGQIDRSLAIITSLVAMGVRFVLVGLGRQNSWLYFINQLSSGNVLKVDRSFISSITGKEDDRAFLFRLFDLFESRGLELIVSGIETYTQQDFIKRPGLLVQGFALDERDLRDPSSLESNISYDELIEQAFDEIEEIEDTP